MVKRLAWYKVVVPLSAIPLLLAGFCFIDSLRYPRIARSAYWRHPNLLIRATAARLFPGKGVSSNAVMLHARQLGQTDDLGIRLLYLPDLPTDDKTIKGRVFGLVRKGARPESKEELFWVVTPDCRRCIINDHMLAYEYRTGRLVCAANTSRIGEFAVE